MKTKIALSMLTGISMVVPLLIFLVLAKVGVESPIKEIVAIASIGGYAWLSVRLTRSYSVTELPVIAFISAEVFSFLFSLLGAVFFRGLIKGVEPFSGRFFISHLKVTLFVFAAVLASFILAAFFLKMKDVLLDNQRR